MKRHVFNFLIFLLPICFLNTAFAEGSLIGRDDNRKQYYLQDLTPSDSVILRQAQQFFELTEPYQNYFGTQVNTMANQIDEWVSDKTHFEEVQNNHFEVQLRNRYETSSQKFSLQVNFRVKLYFPNTEKRFKLYIESARDGLYDTNREGTGAVQKPNPISNQQEDAVQATIRGRLLSNKNYKLSLDVGGSFNGIQPDPMLGLRSRYEFLNSTEHQNLIVQRLYWQRFKGGVFDNFYRHNWRINNYKLVRFETQLTWWNVDRYWQASQTLSLYDKINVHRFFTYSLRGDWSTKNSPLHNENYGVGFSWRERAYKKLVYVEFNPYLNYRHDLKTKQYDIEPSIELNFEFHFFKPATD